MFPINPVLFLGGVIDMAQIKVSTEKLQSASREMKGVMGEIKSIASNLNSTAHGVTSGWRGSSVSSFNDMWRRWNNAMNHLAEAIETTTGQLNTASEVYEETDRNAVSISR
jgi:WXG100 family type VII secretion target